jgi:hypothetical protein
MPPRAGWSRPESDSTSYEQIEPQENDRVEILFTCLSTINLQRGLTLLGRSVMHARLSKCHANIVIGVVLPSRRSTSLPNANTVP